MSTDNSIARLLDAVGTLLIDAADRGEVGPSPGDEEDYYPRDKDGNAWYPDWFEVMEALAAARVATGLKPNDTAIFPPKEPA